MRAIVFCSIAAVSILVFALFPVEGFGEPRAAIDPLQEVSKIFPGSVRVTGNGEHSVEFCPDNTCDLFVARGVVSLEILKDLSYLFLYFFSDYYVLDEWRSSEESGALVREILSKKPYQICKSGTDEETARCLLLRFSRDGHIQLYAVRYDERVRSLDHRDIREATSVTRLKSKKK